MVRKASTEKGIFGYGQARTGEPSALEARGWGEGILPTSPAEGADLLAHDLLVPSSLVLPLPPLLGGLSAFTTQRGNEGGGEGISYQAP